MSTAEYHRQYRARRPEVHRAAVKRWRENHPEQAKAAIAAWREANPRYEHAYQLRRRYGMTVEQYDALLESQNGTCAICRTDKPGGRGKWHVDHNHATGAIRGLLCFACNRGLGCFQDDPILLEGAVRYLCRKYEGVRLAEYLKEIQ